MVVRFGKAALAGLAVAGLTLAVPAAAEPLRLHGTGAAAKAVGGHQKDEFGFGFGLLGAVEMPLEDEIGFQLELGHIWLSEGDPPSDPRLAPLGAASGTHGAVGLRVRPFIGSWDGKTSASKAGLWFAGAGGVSRTGGELRTLLDAHIGWDVLMNEGRFGIGPTVGYVHVFQADDEVRPADANIVLVGVHAMWDGGRPKPATDRDGDGIFDSVDQCPDDPEDKDGFQDEDGCPENDNDKDGIFDTLDKCPNDPEDKDGFEDADGCPDVDNDQDGILDPKDKCPNDPEDKDGFEDEDGCPDFDNDQDGIVDGEDKCPLEPETKNGYADDDGCPDDQDVRVVGDKIVLDDRVHFWTNSAKIRPVSYPLLSRVAKIIKDNPTYVHIEVQGHTDERGPEWFNEKLSQDRAQSVVDFLVKEGIDGKRLSAKGFGSSQPLVSKASEHAYFMNRRVEFGVTREVRTVVTQGGPKPPDGESSGGGAK